MDLMTVYIKVGRPEMMWEGIPKRRASMSKTTRGKSNVDTRLREEIGGRQSEADALTYKDAVKMTSITGLRCGVNGGQK